MKVSKKDEMCFQIIKEKQISISFFPTHKKERRGSASLFERLMRYSCKYTRGNVVNACV